MSTGWSGPEIPLDMQALVVAKHFNQGLNILVRQLAMLHKEINEALRDAKTGSDIISALNDHPFFEFVMRGLVDGQEKFKDQLFRWDADRIGQEAQEEIRDAMVYLPVMCWVSAGATFPDGAFDEVVQGDE